MAENKTSFLLYCDLIHTIRKMPNEKAGELFKHILSYVNDENPVTDDLLIDLTFEPIKQNLKRDLVKYEKIVNRNSINGSKGGRPKKEEEPKKPTGLFVNPNEPKKADSDNDSVNDNVNVKEKENIVAKKPLLPKKINLDTKDFTDCVGYWLKEFHPGWTFGGAKGKALKSILKKINTVLKNSNTEIKENTVFDSFKLICSKLPEYYKNKDLEIIDSKFNEIVTEIQNKKDGTTASNKSIATATGIAAIKQARGLQ